MWAHCTKWTPRWKSASASYCTVVHPETLITIPISYNLLSQHVHTCSINKTGIAKPIDKSITIDQSIEINTNTLRRSHYSPVIRWPSLKTWSQVIIYRIYRSLENRLKFTICSFVYAFKNSVRYARFDCCSLNVDFKVASEVCITKSPIDKTNLKIDKWRF